MSYLFKPEIPQFPRLTRNGDNFESWRQNIVAVLELIDLGDFPHDLPRHKATKDAKEGGDGHGGQGEGCGNGRGRRRGRKPAVHSEDASRATNDRPGSRAEPSTIMHRHDEREDTHAYNATIPSPQDSKTAPQGDLDTPGATQIVHHDWEDAYERSVAVPEALDVYNESKAIERQDDMQAVTYASNATQESNPDAPGDEATPDNAPTHLEASDAFSSYRIAKLCDPEPTMLDDTGPDPFRVGEGDIRQKSTFQDGLFDEGETADQGIKTNRTQQPVDRDVVSIGQNGGEATKLDVPGRPEPPARPPEAGEASKTFERLTGGPGPPIHLPKAAEPSQASQTTPTPSNQPPATGHTPESNNDARHAPQSTPERVHAIPSMRACTPTVFDDGGEFSTKQRRGSKDKPTGLLHIPHTSSQGYRAIRSGPSVARANGEHARARRECGTRQRRALRKPQRRMRLNQRFTTQKAAYEGVPHQRRQSLTHPEHPTAPMLNESDTRDHATPKGVGAATGASEHTRHARIHTNNDSRMLLRGCVSTYQTLHLDRHPAQRHATPPQTPEWHSLKIDKCITFGNATLARYHCKRTVGGRYKLVYFNQTFAFYEYLLYPMVQLSLQHCNPLL
ncbi:hypothetical protein BDV93DRAFT_516586 [Ceratobasidium sp. AG-I]|nr:hypothetical protein BDV93DRAFT_516586 [Ceratobasidium sp. AG-I]